HYHPAPRDLHSFPTRRSSDLRGQPVEPELNRVLAIYLQKDPVADGPALRTYVSAIKGMVEAGSSSADVAGYLRHAERELGIVDQDRKSTRLNSSHDQISYAVF